MSSYGIVPNGTALSITVSRQDIADDIVPSYVFFFFSFFLGGGREGGKSLLANDTNCRA